MRIVSDAFRWLAAHWFHNRLRFYLYLLEDGLTYDSQADWRNGATGSGGTSDLTVGGRTVSTVRPWMAPDRSLRSPEWVGFDVTSPSYEGALGAPNPKPKDGRGKELTAATVMLDSTTTAGRLTPRLFLSCLSSGIGRLFSTNWPNVTNWTEGNSGGGGSSAALNPRLQIVANAAVAGTEISRWRAHDTARDIRGKVVVLPTKKLGAPAADYDVGSFAWSKDKNTATDPLAHIDGKNGIEVGVKTNFSGTVHVWFAHVWVNGVQTVLTLSSNPNVGEGVLVVEVNAAGDGGKFRFWDKNGDAEYTLFNASFGATLNFTSGYLNCVMRTSTTVSRDVIFGTDEAVGTPDKGLRVMSGTKVLFRNLEASMVAEVRDTASVVKASATANGSGEADVDLDTISPNPILRGQIPYQGRLAVKEAGPGALIQETGDLVDSAVGDVDGNRSAIYGGDTVKFAQDVSGTVEYATIFSGAEWVSPKLDSRIPDGWGRVAEWHLSRMEGRLYDLIYDSTGALQTATKLYEPFEGQATVIANGGATHGVSFRTGKTGKACFAKAGTFVQYPPDKIALSGLSWVQSFWVGLAKAGAMDTFAAAATGEVRLVETVGGTGYYRVKLDLATKVVTVEVSGGTPFSSTHTLTAAQQAKDWLHFQVGSRAGSLFLEVDSVLTNLGATWIDLPTGFTAIRFCSGNTLSSGYEIGMDVLMSRTGAWPTNTSAYYDLSQIVSCRAAASVSALDSASWVTLDSVPPGFRPSNPQRGRYAQFKVNFPATHTAQLSLPNFYSLLNKFQWKRRMRLTERAVRERGAVSRRMEEAGSIGILSRSGTSYSCTLNNEDGGLSPNVRDAVFNNCRVLEAPLEVWAGFELDDGSEEILREGRFYVTSPTLASLGGTVRIESEDSWKRISDKTLSKGLSSLSADLSADAPPTPNEMQIADDPAGADGFSASGDVEIDGEIIGYTGRTTGPPHKLTTLTRAKRNTVAAAHKQETPVRQATINSTVDAIEDKISVDAGLSSGELQLAGHNGATYLVNTSLRQIPKSTGTATDVPLLGSVDTGEGHGQIGRPVARLEGIAGALSVCRRNTSQDPPLPWDLQVVNEIVAFGGGNRWQQATIRTQHGIFLAAKDLRKGTEAFRPTQVAGVIRSVATDSGRTRATYRIELYGAYQTTLGSDRFWFDNLDLVVWQPDGRVEVNYQFNSAVDFGSSPVLTGLGAGPGNLVWVEQESKLLYVTHETGQVRIYEVTLPVTTSLPLPSPSIALLATFVSYELATGLAYIPSADNPLGNSTARYVLSARDDTTGRPFLVLLSTAWAVVGSTVDSAEPVIGLGFVQASTQIFGNAGRVSYLLGSHGRGAGGEDTVKVWDPVTQGNAPVGVVGIFDWFFQHPKLTNTPTVKLNGTALVAATDYKLDENGSYPRIGMEKLLSGGDQLAGTYTFLFSVSDSPYPGLSVAEALGNAAMIPLQYAWMDEDEVLRIAQKGLLRGADVVLHTSEPGPALVIGPPVPESASTPSILELTLRLDLDRLKNRVKLRKANPFDPDNPNVIVRDVSAILASTTSALNTIDLFKDGPNGGYFDLEIENLWIYAIADGKNVCDLLLRYYDLKWTGTVECPLWPVLTVQIGDTVAILDPRLGIGTSFTSRPIGHLWQVLAVNRDHQGRKATLEVREL